ncbi:type II secretion system F family protein [Motiliproteus sp. SC1-56]|uniref:type II secretion system F family protein n=1 Tax=Motiliproteus sp. SC1-56 TaxID=2799565 RepID=UPI001A8DDD41|nr:type II secretion system F family protein [Motiliproteus sp. SC1-56]
MFDYIFALISSQTSGPDQARMVFSVLAFISMLSLMAAIYLIVNGLTSPSRRRLKELNEGDRSPSTPAADSNGVGGFLTFLSGLIPNKQSDRDKTRETLIMAGYRKKESVSFYYASKILLSLTFIFIGLLISKLSLKITPEQTLFIVTSLFIAGFMLPNFILKKLLTHRQRIIRNGFPDALDLLVVCVESGLSLTSAFQRVAEKVEVSCPELSEEMATVNVEIRAGLSRQEAFQNLVKRTGLEEIRGLITNLEQSIRFGTSIADTLRIYSEEFRDKRMQRAEEQAGKISTKMIFPMVTCLWPGFFIIAVGPAILQVFEAFSK